MVLWLFIYIVFNVLKIVFLSSINDVRPDPFSSPGELFFSTANRVKCNYEKTLNVSVFLVFLEEYLLSFPKQARLPLTLQRSLCFVLLFRILFFYGYIS